MRNLPLKSFKKIFRLTVFFALIAASSLFGETQSHTLSPADTEIVKHDATSYTLSIDPSSPGLQLKVTPPPGTYTLGSYYKQFQAKTSPILEYIPTGETFDNWSSIFTIDQSSLRTAQSSPNLSAQHITGLISWISTQARKVSLIHHETVVKKDFSISKAAIQYQLHDGKCELLYAEYYCKGKTVCGIQYTEKLIQWINSSEAQKETDKISKKVEGLLSVVG